MTDFKNQCRATGPCPARLMVVGEAPGKAEVASGKAFDGPSGDILNELMAKAGLPRGLAFVTNVLREMPPWGPKGADFNRYFPDRVKDRAPEHRMVNNRWASPEALFGLEKLRWEIDECKPDLVIACGNAALWALCGKWGIRKWRGSIIQGEWNGHKFKIIPIIHPGGVFREWSLRPLILHDLRRAAAQLALGPVVNKPKMKYIIRPTFKRAVWALRGLRRRLDLSNGRMKIPADIETRAGHIACLGIGWSKTQAICIPFMCVERLEGYWTAEEETTLIGLTRDILTHPNAFVIGQNWCYDRQYIHRWHFYTPNLGRDTMVSHHAMFSYSEKGLGHLSSLYCENHLFWKDDGRLWDPSKPENEYWTYNCDDCTRTFEVEEGEEQAIRELTPSWPRLPEVEAFQTRLQDPVLRMMLRGVRSNDLARAKISMEMMERIREVTAEVHHIAGQPLNIGSSPQMTDFFYQQLNQSPIYARLPNGARGNLTTDDDALQLLWAREPILRPLIDRIRVLRSAGVFKSTFVDMRRDIDGRLRCSYNTAGTITYRFSSSKNAFGSGGNLQNVPVGDEDEEVHEYIVLPNIRKLFVPDPGHTIFDIDGDSADLRIVTGESGCRQMQAYFAERVKPYVEISKEFYHDPTITKHHPSYKKMKALCHGSNYGGTGPGLSERIGLPVHDVERMQKWYFGMCPEIKTWQDDIRNQVRSRGWIENPFGYRMYFQDRYSEKLANEALAWTPQSSVGILINHSLVQIDEQLPWCQLLLQVHDSLTGQFPSYMGGEATREIIRAGTVEVPCKTGTIVVPMGVKTSQISWGDCE